jgi:hypothetical protein
VLGHVAVGTKGQQIVEGVVALLAPLDNVATFEDRSTLCTRYQGTATPEAKRNTSRWETTCEFIKGAGRFEGVQRGGSFTGRRLASTPGAAAQYYIGYDLIYTLPSK